MWAASDGYTDLVELLIFADADVNISTTIPFGIWPEGSTALSIAHDEGHTETAQILRDAGAVE